MIKNPLFYCKNKDTYPPFKNGFYMEEYFLKQFTEDKPQLTRKYIPALWTNFQIEGWFQTKKQEMQNSLNQWVKENPSPNGYFTIAQYDDGPLLDLPENTIVYGACSGDEVLPLVYQDVNNTLIKIPRKSFKDKTILCSFIGSNTSNDVLPNVRGEMAAKLERNSKFLMHFTNGWTPVVDSQKQNNFISTTVNSKFALAPRGYGRSSFRFFEIFQLGAIPVYLWNDKEWLPFKDIIDYSKICININISEIHTLETILLSIDETKYNNMLKEYHKIKKWFSPEGIYDYITSQLSGNKSFTSLSANFGPNQTLG